MGEKDSIGRPILWELAAQTSGVDCTVLKSAELGAVLSAPAGPIAPGCEPEEW